MRRLLSIPTRSGSRLTSIASRSSNPQRSPRQSVPGVIRRCTSGRRPKVVRDVPAGRRPQRESEAHTLLERGLGDALALHGRTARLVGAESELPQPRNYIALPGRLDRRGLSPVALPDRALDVSGDVARVGAWARASARARGGGELAPLEPLDQGIEGALEHLDEVAAGNRVAEQLLGVVQLLLGAPSDRDLQ